MTDSNSIGGHEVAQWIRNNPTFLQQFPDLALAIEIPREEGKPSSLATYQLEILRDKNRDLSRRLNDLYAVATANEQLTRDMHQLTLSLVKQSSAADVWRALVAAITEDFGAQAVRSISFASVPELDDESWHRTLSKDDPQLTPFRDLIATGEPICGRLNPDKQSMLYADLADRVQSSALVSLGSAGLLAIGSFDPNRFYPGMGTLFLELLSETVPAVLSRLPS